MNAHRSLHQALGLLNAHVLNSMFNCRGLGVEGNPKPLDCKHALGNAAIGHGCSGDEQKVKQGQECMQTPGATGARPPLPLLLLPCTAATTPPPATATSTATATATAAAAATTAATTTTTTKKKRSPKSIAPCKVWAFGKANFSCKNKVPS